MKNWFWTSSAVATVCWHFLFFAVLFNWYWIIGDGVYRSKNFSYNKYMEIQHKLKSQAQMHKFDCVVSFLYVPVSVTPFRNKSART